MAPKTRPSVYSVSSAADVLRAFIALSQDGGAELSEAALMQRLHELLSGLLPGRSITITTFEPGSCEPTCPSAPGLTDGSDGFSVLMVAGDAAIGEVKIAYSAEPRIALPIVEDKAVVEPLVNQAAGMAHTSRLLRQVIHAEKLATVGQIAAGVAHEINNPLTSIQVCAEAVLRKASLAAQGRVPNSFESVDVERLKRIQDGAERIRRFSKDLVSYARPSLSEVETFAFNDVIQHALSFCEHVLVDAQATLQRELAAELPPIHAVRDQLMQVVTNLVTNAAYALGGKGGTIRVRTASERDARVSLSVSDTGSGIKVEDQPRIFDPFFTTKPAGSGTGLGLSVVRSIVYAHGGQIAFQTHFGKGTTFVVTLPINHLGPIHSERERATA